MSPQTGRNIFVTSPGIADEARQLLAEARCNVAYADACAGNPDLLAQQILAHNTEGLIVRAGKVGAKVIAAAGSLRVISKHGIGVDGIDVEAATERGIPVFFTPGANTESVAEHALALILALARRVPQENARLKAGLWDKAAYSGFELAGKTLGVVGFGRIGGRLAQLVASLDMKVLAYDPYAVPAPAGAHVTMLASLDELLSKSDFVSLHCPLTKDTHGMLGAAELKKMRPDAYLVNTARGALVDEAALVDALKEGTIAGAALDTFATEPPNLSAPLFSMDNVIVTTHVGGFSPQSLRAMGVAAAKNVLSVLEGTDIDPSCVVNPEVLHLT